MAKREPAPDKWADFEKFRNEVWPADDDVPPQAFTLYEYQKRYGLPKSTSESQLKRLVDSGRLNRGYRQQKDSNGRCRRMTLYWMA